jgi:DNA-binding response OmpR family regulator
MTRKILIVEDEENILTLLSVIFEENDNYQLFCARNGAEALNMVKTYSPDFIILDIQLPIKNGYEVCRAVKSNPMTSQIKVLMVSGIEQNRGWQNAQEAGADDYLAKPFNPATLTQKVEDILMSYKKPE